MSAQRSTTESMANTKRWEQLISTLCPSLPFRTIFKCQHVGTFVPEHWGANRSKHLEDELTTYVFRPSKDDVAYISPKNFVPQKYCHSLWLTTRYDNCKVSKQIDHHSFRIETWICTYLNGMELDIDMTISWSWFLWRIISESSSLQSSSYNDDRSLVTPVRGIEVWTLAPLLTGTSLNVRQAASSPRQSPAILGWHWVYLIEI